jgi:hypothetical protein
MDYQSDEMILLTNTMLSMKVYSGDFIREMFSFAPELIASVISP